MKYFSLWITVLVTGCLQFHSDNVTIEDARLNYLNHEDDMQKLVHYFKEIVPDSKSATFTLSNENGTMALHCEDTGYYGPRAPRGGEFGNETANTQTCLSELDWTLQTVDSLESLLKKVNCYCIFDSGDEILVCYHADDVCSLYYSFGSTALDSVRLETIRIENEKRILNDSTLVMQSCIL